MNCKTDTVTSQRATSVGWETRLARLSMAALVFEAVSGLAITLSPFHASIRWGVLVHTVVGALTLLPLAWYCVRHWRDYRHHAPSHATVLGYAGRGGAGGHVDRFSRGSATTCTAGFAR